MLHLCAGCLKLLKYESVRADFKHYTHAVALVMTHYDYVKYRLLTVCGDLYADALRSEMSNFTR